MRGTLDVRDAKPFLFSCYEVISSQLRERRVDSHTVELDCILGIESSVALTGDRDSLLFAVDEHLQRARVN